MRAQKTGMEFSPHVQPGGSRGHTRTSGEVDARPKRPSAMPLASSPAEQRYCLLFEQSLAGIYRTTLEGRFLDCNESMALMLGYASREALMARNASELYFGDADRESFLARLQATGRLSNSECRLRRRDGQPVYVLENVSLVPDEQGQLRVIQGNMVDITERKAAEEALRRSEKRYRARSIELRRLAVHLHTVREEERLRIAREIHDELGQTLTALHMDLHWLQSRTPADADESQGRIRAMIELVGRTLQILHRICADLRPTVLDDFGLVAAVEWQAREFEDRTGIGCRLRLPEENMQLSDEQALAVFRIFQESLTNIARHARATKTGVSLRLRGGVLGLVVRDDGIGIASEQVGDSRSLGLLGMRERALVWGGSVQIEGKRGQGTTVHVSMPVAADGSGERQ